MNMYVQNLTQLVRCFEEGSFQDKTSSYVSTLTIVYENEHTVILMGLQGSFNKTSYLLIWKYLNEQGVTTIKIERKGVWITKPVPILPKELAEHLISVSNNFKEEK